MAIRHAPLGEGELWRPMLKAVLSLILLFGLIIPTLDQSPSAAGQHQGRPNFVVIVADDLDVASVSKMTAVKRLLAAHGVTFERFFATTPLCCPSRSSILRGQYAHNHGVLRNTGEDAGFAAFHASGNENTTLATLLDDAGYETALIGKYLNGYAPAGDGQTYVPPGWDYWAAGVDHDAYTSFNYTLNVNGALEDFGRGARNYVTDVLAAHALEFLDEATASSEPFFLYLAPYAPHAPATPAPRDKGQFSGAAAPRSPAFNERNVRDKPLWVRQSGPLRDDRIQRIDENYQDRLESLLAVDDLVGDVVKRLEEQEALNSTYIFFLSDNGYFMGEHRQPHGKDAPYDPATRVPLVIRGPDTAADANVEDIALNIDLLPTITDLAGLATPSFVDGRSLRPLLRGEGVGWREAGLLEGFGKETESNEGPEKPTPAFRALRGKEVLYVEYETGERELYNLRRDPFQLENLAGKSPNTLLRVYSRQLDALARCAGQECARLENESLAAPGKGSKREPGKADNREAKNKKSHKKKSRSHDRRHAKKRHR